MNSRANYNQLVQLIKAHFLEILREPAVLFWGILFPIFMALGLGIAFSKKSDTIRHVAIVEETISKDNTVVSFLDSFLDENTKKVLDQNDGNTSEYKFILNDEKLGNLIIYFQKTSWDKGTVFLKQGKVPLLISEESGKVIYHFDPSNQDAQLLYRQLNKIITPGFNASKKDGNNVEPLTVKGTRYVDFLIPGLIAMGIMMSCMWGLSYGLIEKRSKKLLRRMVATPMKKSFFLFSIITVRFVMNFIEGGLLFFFSWLVFDITIQGSIPALIIIFITGNFAFAGIAIFFSSHTSNTEVGNGLVNVVVLPMMIGSGVFFSYHNFPDWLIPAIQKLPLTLVADGFRSIFLEGAGFAETAAASAILFLTGLVFFLTGLKVFKWH